MSEARARVDTDPHLQAKAEARAPRLTRWSFATEEDMRPTPT